MKNDKTRAEQKIKMYHDYVKQLIREQNELVKMLNDSSFNELQKAQIQQRLFVLGINIEGHEAFIHEYQARINPTTYRKSV